MEAAKRAAKDAIPLEVTLAVAADLTEARLQEMSDLFAGFSDDLWVCTQGNFYIASVDAKDKAKKGNVRVGAGDIEKKFLTNGGITVGRGSASAYMKVAGRCSVFTFVHEGGHMYFWLPDEYLNRPPGCPECIMVGGNMKGFGPGKWKLCDASNHTGKGPDCWARLKKKHPGVRYPNPDWPMDLPFECKVTVRNTGS